MKKADKPNVFIIEGDNNKVIFSEERIPLSHAIVFVAFAIIVLAIKHCCPEELADFVRWLTSIAPIS